MAPGARSRLASVASALCGVVLVLGMLAGQCSCQAEPMVYTIGGPAGWTDAVANMNYTEEMSRVQFKAGDSIRFSNNDTKDHDYYQVYTQEEYDACNSNNNTGWPLVPGDVNDEVFPAPVYRVWIFDTQYCINGLKVMFTVLNADGTAVAPPTGADPPSLNAVQPDPEAPPAPPTPPLGMAGGPAPNAADTQSRANWMAMTILASASSLAASAIQLNF